MAVKEAVRVVEVDRLAAPLSIVQVLVGRRVLATRDQVARAVPAVAPAEAQVAARTEVAKVALQDRAMQPPVVFSR